MESIFYTTDGKGQFVKPSNGTDFSLEELQKFVGGYIEVVRLHDNRIMVVNEEGKCRNLPINIAATQLLRLTGRHDTIIGNALICDTDKVR